MRWSERVSHARRVSVLNRWPESAPVAWPPGKLDADGSGVSGS